MGHRGFADRAHVMSLRHEGLNQAEIIRRTGFPREFVRRWIQAASIATLRICLVRAGHAF